MLVKNMKTNGLLFAAAILAMTFSQSARADMNAQLLGAFDLDVNQAVECQIIYADRNPPPATQQAQQALQNIIGASCVDGVSERRKVYGQKASKGQFNRYPRDP